MTDTDTKIDPNEETITSVSTDIQERLSIAYITAVAARAGCQISEPKVDRIAIDVSIRPVSGAPVQIDLQLKASYAVSRIEKGTKLSFQLDVRTYDKLRRTDVQAPQLLVVYEMPKADTKWLSVLPTGARLQHAAYWVDLRGRPPVTTGTTAVHLPVANLFDHNAIIDILARAHARAKLGLAWA